MKLLTAVIRPHELDAVRHALERHAVLGMTLGEIHRSGGAGRRDIRGGTSILADVTSALRVESVLHDDLVERVLADLSERLDARSEAQVQVVDVVYVERVRTRERGADAV